MRKLLLASAAILALVAVTPAKAGSSLGVGFNFGNANTQTGAASVGSAAAGALATAPIPPSARHRCSHACWIGVCRSRCVRWSERMLAPARSVLATVLLCRGANSTNAGLGVGLGVTNRLP